MTSSRCIRLRRPAVLADAGGRFVPTTIPLDEIDDAWSRARERNPRLFDGPLWHVRGVSRNGHGGVTVHVVESSYRFHAVRALGVDTGIRPLGVKAIVMRGTRVLMGRRSAQVHSQAGRWEFVPGGTLPPGVEPEAQVARELAEECGWRCDATPRPIALLFDDLCHTWEIVHRASGRPEAAARRSAESGWEYDEIAELQPESISKRTLSRAAELMTALLATEPIDGGTGAGGDASSGAGAERGA
ncbi:MAG: NUDIX domain-containing protein [Phycisphaerae bacterium]|nr:NUDIX domain-containing protein [Phycisphaerae bacterium]